MDRISNFRRFSVFFVAILLPLAAATADETEKPAWNGQIGIAHAWVSGDGNEDSFRSQYDLRDGFIVEDLTLEHSGGKQVEQMTFHGWGFGSALPDEGARLDLSFRGDLKLSVDYDRRSSFFRLAGSDLRTRSDEWDIARWKAHLEVDSWDSLVASVTLRHHKRDGTIYRPLRGLNDLYPVGVNLDETMTEGSFRLETRDLPVRIELEQSFARYERQNRRFAADEAALSGSTVNLLESSSTHVEDTQDVPTTRLTLSGGNSRLSGLATLLYSDADMDTGGISQSSFGIAGGTAGTFSFLDDVTGSAQADTFVGAVRLGYRLSPRWHVEVSGDIRDASTDARLLGRRLVRATSPFGGALEISEPIAENSVYDFQHTRGAIRLEHRRPTWTLWTSGFTAGRDVSWRQTTDADRFDVDRSSDGFGLGGTWTPGRRLDLDVEYQRGDFTRFVFRTDPETVDRFSVRLRAPLADGWRVGAHGRSESSNNPATVSGLDHDVLATGFDVGWTAEDGSADFGLNLEKIGIETETGIVLPNGLNDQSRYDTSLLSLSLHGHARLGIVEYTGFLNYLTDDGATWPVDSFNASARAGIDLSRALNLGVFVEYWSYDEERSALDDYDVMRSGVSVSWRFQ